MGKESYDSAKYYQWLARELSTLVRCGARFCVKGRTETFLCFAVEHPSNQRHHQLTPTAGTDPLYCKDFSTGATND